ncbi:MAG: 50S ribosomal protein L32 [Firmicutes bacterium]|nr:50S ribosomal protein L32 [Bacillota bacterium]MBO2520267.1 50S ribosomal protein L32 [Bacillota bacterium]
MANPKRRHSKARTRTRRSTWKAAVPEMSRCPQCHQPKLPHRVCPHCGAYAGRTVLQAGAES